MYIIDYVLSKYIKPVYFLQWLNKGYNKILQAVEGIPNSLDFMIRGRVTKGPKINF